MGVAQRLQHTTVNSSSSTDTFDLPLSASPRRRSRLPPPPLLPPSPDSPPSLPRPTSATTAAASPWAMTVDLLFVVDAAVALLTALSPPTPRPPAPSLANARSLVDRSRTWGTNSTGSVLFLGRSFKQLQFWPPGSGPTYRVSLSRL